MGQVVEERSGQRTFPRVPKIIKTGSDCTGMDSRDYAMKVLGARYRNMFTSGILQEARNFIAEAHHSKKIHEDMLTKKRAAAVAASSSVAKKAKGKDV